MLSEVWQVCPEPVRPKGGAPEAFTVRGEGLSGKDHKRCSRQREISMCTDIYKHTKAVVKWSVDSSKSPKV